MVFWPMLLLGLGLWCSVGLYGPTGLLCAHPRVLWFIVGRDLGGVVVVVVVVILWPLWVAGLATGRSSGLCGYGLWVLAMLNARVGSAYM